MAARAAHAEPVEACGPGTTEAGIFLGGFVSNFYHQFYDDSLLTAAARPQLGRVSAHLGARVSYFLHDYIGVEAEASVIVASVAGDRGRALIHGLGAQVVAQYPGVLTPFVDLGIDLEHLSSAPDVLGNDTDFPIHLGVGLRWYITNHLALRVDGRLLRGPSSKDPYTLDASYGEVSAGISFVQRPNRPVVTGR